MQDKPLFVGRNRLFESFYEKADEFCFMPDTRIPALITVKNGEYAGNVIAAADMASSGTDWGRIEIAVRISTDNGESFSDAVPVISPPVRKYPYKSNEYSAAFVIDPLLVENKNGKVILLVTFYPECKGLHNRRLLEKKAPYIVQDGKTRLALYSGKSPLDGHERKNDKTFTLHEDGFVYTSDGEKTNYYLPKRHNPKYAYATLGDMYYARNGSGKYIMKYPPLIPEYSEDDDIYVGNIYLSVNKPVFSFDEPQFVQKWEVDDEVTKKPLCIETSAAPLRCAVTSYIWKCESTDGGKTFSKPVDITPFVKIKEDGDFFGVSPGNGIMLKNTSENAKLLAPVYALGKSAVIISDDDGKTWRRGEQKYSKNIDESQLVEATDGRIFCFGRPAGGGYVPLSISKNGGESFEKEKKCSLYTPQCQKSVINLPIEMLLPDGLVNDGNFILVSTPTGHNGRDTTRTDGKIYLGCLKQNGIQLVKSYNIKDLGKYVSFNEYADFFAYSSISVLPDDSIGILYEAYPSGYIVFSKFKL